MRKIQLLSLVLILYCSTALLFGETKILPLENTNLLLLQEEVNQVRLDAKDAKAERWPKINLEFSGTWMTDNTLGPFANPFPTIAGLPPEISLQLDNTAYDFGITLTQPIFTWGKIQATVRLAESLVEARQYVLLDKKREVSSEIASRMGAITHLMSIEILLEKQLEMGNELVEIVDAAFKQGMALELDVAETTVALQQIESVLLETRYAAKSQLLELQELTGNKSIQIKDIQFPFNEQAVNAILETPVEVLLDQALAADRPSLMAMNTLQKTAIEAEKIARGSIYGKPDFALMVKAGYSSPEFPFIENTNLAENDFAVSLSVGIKTTLWDGGKILNSIRRAASQSAYAQIETTATRNTIEKILRKNHLLLSSTIERLALQRNQTANLYRRAQLNEELAAEGYVAKETAVKSRMEMLSSKIAEHRLIMQAESAYRKILHLID